MGSGYAGSLIAMIARRLGRSVVLLEKERHPRVVIGESSTPLSNLLLESLADRYDLPQLKPLTKWGRWQQSYPGVECGLKRGFSFVHHEVDGASDHVATPQQLLVAASPNDLIADTHWYRADVDHFLVRQAQEIGVEYVDEFKITGFHRDARGWTLRGGEGTRARTVQATFLIDATGPQGFLHRALGMRELPLAGLPATSALYSHFTNVKEFANTAAAPVGAPYPMDAAALHHVFDGGWMWVLRFNNGVTSAGVAATQAISTRFRLSEGQAAWTRLLAALPRVQEQFADAETSMPFTFVPQLSFRSSQIVGEDWALLPSAAGFVDPLLSTGFPLTLLGITRLAAILERDWASPRLKETLRGYERETDAELLATARLIGSLYRNMGDFSTFRTLSLLYFAAASYAETARRLEKPAVAGGFLLHDHPEFGPQSRRLIERAATNLDRAGKAALCEAIYRLIRDFDVAGLGRRPADHCYPVRAEDLFAGAHLLDAEPTEIERMLERSGFYAGAVETPECIRG